jgi:hypothetical protein
VAIYDRLERDSATPKRVVDHSRIWEKLEPVASVNSSAGERLAVFCESKRISVEALAALGTRLRCRKNGAVELAFACVTSDGAVTAIKYRPLDGSSHDSRAEEPSAWLQPIIAGNRDSLDWLIAEGETDAARLYGLVGDRCAILAMPAGARTFRREWADLVPRGARVGLALDADDDGDVGADKIARLLGGRTFRLQPPAADWCDWPGNRDEFLELAAAAGRTPIYEFASYADFMAADFPDAEPLYGEPGQILLARGSLLMVYGADGSGKSTWSIDGMVHLAAGVEWLGHPVLRPVRFLIIEQEGPPSLFRTKIEDRIAAWDGPDPRPNLFFYVQPWGEFSFANPDARAALTEFCEANQIDVVTANPTLGLGVGASGKPDETQEFVDWLTECGLKSALAFWLLHHENKAGQISGDWGRHPDTKVALQRDGNRQRTKLDWNKTRWAPLLPPEGKLVMLEWILEAGSYTVTEITPGGGASDGELEQAIRDYLTDNSLAPTRSVWAEVKGSKDRISAALERRFDCVPGKRGAKLWFIPTDRTEPSNGEPGQSDENLHG